MKANKVKQAYYNISSHTNYWTFKDKKAFAKINDMEYYLTMADPVKPLKEKTAIDGMKWYLPPSEKELRLERTFGIANADGEIIIPCNYAVIYDLDFEQGHLCQKANYTLIRFKDGVELPCTPIDEFYQDLHATIDDMDCLEDDFIYLEIVNPIQDCVIDLLNRLPNNMTVKQLMDIFER